MRRFTEIPLLVAYMHLLSFAKGLQATVKHDALPKDGAIRGLLVTRQSPTCQDGNYFVCEAETFCCPIGWECCGITHVCCEPGHYCVVASNDAIACCPNGQVCSGPGGPPTSILPNPPTQTTSFRAPTSTTRITTPSTSTFRSTSTFTTLVGAPTQPVGDTTIEVSVLDVNITWSANWVQRTSSCSPSVTSKSTTTGGSSFTYIFQVQPPAIRTGFFYYFNVVNNNALWEIFMDGVSQERDHQFSTSDCTYSQSYFIPTTTGTSASQNLTVLVHGSDSTDPSESWSIEFNKLLIMEPQTSSTSTTLTPTGLALSASRQAQPYQPLLVFAGILMALLYYA